MINKIFCGNIRNLIPKKLFAKNAADNTSPDKTIEPPVQEERCFIPPLAYYSNIEPKLNETQELQLNELKKEAQSITDTSQKLLKKASLLYLINSRITESLLKSIKNDTPKIKEENGTRYITYKNGALKTKIILRSDSDDISIEKIIKSKSGLNSEIIEFNPDNTIASINLGIAQIHDPRNSIHTAYRAEFDNDGNITEIDENITTNEDGYTETGLKYIYFKKNFISLIKDYKSKPNEFKSAGKHLIFNQNNQLLSATENKFINLKDKSKTIGKRICFHPLDGRLIQWDETSKTVYQNQ